MDKHILKNNKITDGKSSKRLFPKQVTAQLPELQINTTHRNVKIKIFNHRTASNIKQ